MSVSRVTRNRYFYKQLKSALGLPNPVRSERDYLVFIGADLHGMDPAGLRCERDRARFMLMLQADDAIIAVSPEGKLVTARAWLEKRLAAIDEALGEAG